MRFVKIKSAYNCYSLLREPREGGIPPNFHTCNTLTLAKFHNPVFWDLAAQIGKASSAVAYPESLEWHRVILSLGASVLSWVCCWVVIMCRLILVWTREDIHRPRLGRFSD